MVVDLPGVCCGGGQGGAHNLSSASHYRYGGGSFDEYYRDQFVVSVHWILVILTWYLLLQNQLFDMYKYKFDNYVSSLIISVVDTGVRIFP